MKKALRLVSPLLLIIILYLRVETTFGQPRVELVDLRCGTVAQHNVAVTLTNIVAAMLQISDQMRTNGFGTAQVGTGPDASYVLAQCYGDLTLLDCALCYVEVRNCLPRCHPSNSGIVYLDGCFVRSANYSFYDEISGPKDKTLCGNATRKDTRFQKSARGALLDAVTEAPNNGGFARPKMSVSGSRNESAYVLANCWSTLNASSCRACLNNASASVMKCLPWSEGRVLNTGCFLRYSDKNFLNEVQGGGGSKGYGNKTYTMHIFNVSTPESSLNGFAVSKSVFIAIVASSAAVALIGALIGLHIRKKYIIQKKRRGPQDATEMAKILRDSSLNFKFSILLKATGYFDDANKLGQGGFGTVYKGVLADGREIAVKRLFVNNKHRAEDFYNEVNLISSVEHKNLVRLLGCCCSGVESLLVYEFLPNASLDLFLFDPNRGEALNWQRRFEIIIGTAEGLVYLHENKNTRIIHRDIKPSNILLDSKLRAKIADFGLARTFQESKSHISTAIVGTFGYMAPEYLAYGQLTEKVDVYSFGILVLEIIAGRQNNEVKNDEVSDSLIVTAWNHFQQGTTEEIFDPNLMLQNYSNNSYIKNDILRVVHVGLLCTQEVHSLRPLMSTVVQMLKRVEHLPVPTNPPFIDEGTMEFKDTVEDPSYPFNASYNPSVATMSHSTFYLR